MARGNSRSKKTSLGPIQIAIVLLASIPALLFLSTYYQATSFDTTTAINSVQEVINDRQLKEKGSGDINTRTKVEQNFNKVTRSIGATQGIKIAENIRHHEDSSPHLNHDKVETNLLVEEEEPLSQSGYSARFERTRKATGSEPMDGTWMLDCPEVPPPGYPKAYPIMDIINNWGPDRPKPIPPKHYVSFCRFDYKRDLRKALAYRDAELPFILYNVPEADEVATKWAEPGYLEKISGKSTTYKTETSHNNHFMYHSGGRARGSGKKAWRPPTGSEQLTFKEFKKKALACEAKNCSAEENHYYFRITGARMPHFIFDELPFYKPKKSTIFLKDPKQQRGIHCRFGMQGVIAENHYDGSRNIIGVFGGRRRYILAHPNQCDSMYLLPMGHPSGRHSGDACNFHPDCKDAANSVDWSNPDLEKWPKFKNLQANEVILTAGDFLYLPTHWFHYIMSLELNYQCNTRSGTDHTYTPDVKKCGFR